MRKAFLSLACALAVGIGACKKKADESAGGGAPTGGSTTGGGTTTGGTVESTTMPAGRGGGEFAWHTVDGAMAEQFKEKGSASGNSAQAPPLGTLAGEWKAVVTRVEFDGEAAGAGVNVAEVPGFTFIIRAEGGGHILVSEKGEGARMLSQTATGYKAAATDGRPELNLTYVDGGLDGVMPILQPARGTVEFHATRVR